MNKIRLLTLFRVRLKAKPELLHLETARQSRPDHPGPPTTRISSLGWEHQGAATLQRTHQDTLTLVLPEEIVAVVQASASPRAPAGGTQSTGTRDRASRVKAVPCGPGVSLDRFTPITSMLG